MSEAKYTPGRWEAVPDDSVQRPHVIRAANSRAIIAHTYWDRDLMDDADEPDANAKLIAAAPDLAEALEALVAVAGGGPDFFAKVDAARAALRLVGRLP